MSLKIHRFLAKKSFKHYISRTDSIKWFDYKFVFNIQLNFVPKNLIQCHRLFHFFLFYLSSLFFSAYHRLFMILRNKHNFPKQTIFLWFLLKVKISSFFSSLITCVYMYVLCRMLNQQIFKIFKSNEYKRSRIYILVYFSNFNLCYRSVYHLQKGPRI